MAATTVSAAMCSPPASRTPSRSTRLTCADSTTLLPCSACSCPMAAAMSGGTQRESSRSWLSITVTLAPSRRALAASSRPISPPPTMTTVRSLPTTRRRVEGVFVGAQGQCKFATRQRQRSSPGARGQQQIFIGDGLAGSGADAPVRPVNGRDEGIRPVAYFKRLETPRLGAWLDALRGVGRHRLLRQRGAARRADGVRRQAA